jgi:hypothetical protein
MCDRKIHEHIISPLPNQPYFLAIIGSADTDKTGMLISMLSNKHAHRRAFHAVHVVMPQHIIARMKNNIVRRHDKMHTELNLPTLDRVREAVKAATEKGKNSLVVVGDVTTALKDADIERALRDLIYNRPHYQVSIMLLVQSYNVVALSIRKTLLHFLV